MMPRCVSLPQLNLSVLKSLVILVVLQFVFIYLILRYSKTLALQIGHKSMDQLTPSVGHGLIHARLTAASMSKKDATRTSVAIGLAVTTKHAKKDSSSALGIKFPFLKSLLPSFCSTASDGFEYHFYMAYDRDDKHLTQKTFSENVTEMFKTHVHNHCPSASSHFLHLVKCNHTGNPTWAQNDAMIQAYLDDVDYYYRVNDDSVMLSPKWTEIFIKKLSSFSPPNIGVVGPRHKGGNRQILTHDFVHKTHIDIFGFYYPRVFRNWYADFWITRVYKPSRSRKLKSVKLLHTRELGRRYSTTIMETDEKINYVKADVGVLHK